MSKRKLRVHKRQIPKRTCKIALNTTSNSVDHSTSLQQSCNITRKYGRMEGVQVGQCWPVRAECSVHQSESCDIHAGPHGVYSLILCKNENIAVDHGINFVYTISKKLSSNNDRKIISSRSIAKCHVRALGRSKQSRKPVRVIRAVSLKNRYAPKHGFRYDGLYTVDDRWNYAASSGYVKIGFLLTRCKRQSAPPWNDFKQVTPKHRGIKSKLIKSDSYFKVPNHLPVLKSDPEKENNYREKSFSFTDPKKILLRRTDATKVNVGRNVNNGRRKSFKNSVSCISLNLPEKSSTKNDDATDTDANDEKSDERNRSHLLIYNYKFITDDKNILTERLINQINEIKSRSRLDATELSSVSKSGNYFRGFPKPPFRGFSVDETSSSSSSIQILNLSFLIHDLSLKLNRK